MKSTTALLALYLMIMSGCRSQAINTAAVLTAKERFYCDSLNIDSAIVLQLRTLTDSMISPFPDNLEWVLDKDLDIDPKAKKSSGFIFNANKTNSDKIVMDLYYDFQRRGYTIFFLNQKFGIENKPDIIGILKTTDKYQILNQIQTDGINWDIDTDSLIKIIKVFDKKYSLQLIAASADWCEFMIHNDPQDWMTIAREAYKVCPDIVDQGTETVEELAKEIRKTKRLYFWWD